MSIFFSQELLIVAPNDRQALALWEADALEHQERGEHAWETLPVTSWNEFLKGLWEEFWLAGRFSERPETVLNEWQERFLWLQILEDSPLGGPLLNKPAASKLVTEAWRLANAYQLTEELFSPHAVWPEDTGVFLDWCREFQTKCRERGWLESSRLEERLSVCLRDNLLDSSHLPSKIQFSGFAEWTPAQEGLLAALQEMNIEVERVEREKSSDLSGWKSVAVVDGEEELLTAARWARAALEAEGSVRVGIVVPDLSSRRLQVERILTSVLKPSSSLQLTTREDNLHDISIGLPLGAWPVVKDALALLNLNSGYPNISDLRVLFDSPFVGEADQESSSRSLLWNKLLNDGRYQVSWNRVLSLSAQDPKNDKLSPYCCPRLAFRLQSAKNLWEKAEARQRPSQWVSHFSLVLDTLGWPGERKLNSSEYQTVSSWKQSLGLMGSLDSLTGPVGRRECLNLLQRITEETVYQPKVSRGGIEVLGTLEAVGLTFDKLWIVGLHDGAWPGPARPNPYLPFALQRDKGVAHSTPDRELEFSTNITERLLSAAPVGRASFPLNSDEGVCRRSPLLEELPFAEVEQLELWEKPLAEELLLDRGEVETVIDPGPPPADLGMESRGGTGIFKHQAACPFRAFAYLRLGARPTEEVKHGLDARQRGIMLHLALEYFWKEVQSLKFWLNLSPEEKRDQLTQASGRAVQEVKRLRSDVLRGYLAELETLRVRSLLQEWMELEESREPFRVATTEHRVEFEFAGVSLKATIDRIDKLADGSLAVIDYKTGRPRVNDWLGTRPKEPQLPLYAVAVPREVDAICFAILRTGSMEFKGLGRGDELIPGVEASEFGPDGTKPWSQRYQEWTEILTKLADQYRDGYVAVDPVEGPLITCRNCGLEPLCRIDEKEELEE